MTRLDEEVMKELDYATFVNIISNIPSCIFYKDKDLKYRFSSHCWAQLNSDNIIGKTDLEIRKDRENAIKAMEADQEILRSKKGCNYVIKSDIDGDISYLELIKEPIFGPDGEAIGIVGLINDVTEKTLMEQKVIEITKALELKCQELEESNREIKAALEELEKLHSSQKLLTASMNHELRSPLNGIIGMLQLLMEDKNLSVQQYDYAFNAYQSSELMLSIVNDLLDIARMDSNEFTIKKEKFEMQDILNNIQYVAKTQAEKKKLRFKMNVQYDVCSTYLGDANRIKQIILNLVSNGIKYTEQGEVVLTIVHENGELLIVCEDTGQGIPEDVKPHLFDPFVRVNEEKNRHIQGTGLGLSIVKRIIEKMNGTITVESEIDKGTIFSVKIPLEEYRKEEASASAIDYTKLRVLCVDDNEINATVFSSLLNSVGIHSEIAFSGMEAIDKAETYKFDVIFMDHLMPDMDGIETFHAIRENCFINQETPVVMLTGNAEEELQRKYEEEQLDGYLLKPVSKEQILECIHRIKN